MVARPNDRLSSLLPVLALVGTVAAISPLVVLALSRRDDLPIAPVQAPRAASTTDPAIDDAAASSTIELAIEVNPSTAEIFIDGVRVRGNPFRGRFARDSRKHTVFATAPHYFAQLTPWIFASNATLYMALSEEQHHHTFNARLQAPAIPDTGSGSIVVKRARR
jgi:hypothetical protein